MLGESIAYAIPLLIFHSVLLVATTQSRETRLMADLVLSIGGGIYEELLFRVILFGLLTLLLVDCFGLPKDGSLVAVVLITAGAFAAYHHLPPSVEPFHPVSFFFRTAPACTWRGCFFFGDSESRPAATRPTTLLPCSSITCKPRRSFG